MRSFGEEVQKKSGRVATRDVWPWQYLVRHVDEICGGTDKVELTGEKDSIASVYNNSIYTLCTSSFGFRWRTTISTTDNSYSCWV